LRPTTAARTGRPAARRRTARRRTRSRWRGPSRRLRTLDHGLAGSDPEPDVAASSDVRARHRVRGGAPPRADRLVAHDVLGDRIAGVVPEERVDPGQRSRAAHYQPAL